MQEVEKKSWKQSIKISFDKNLTNPICENSNKIQNKYFPLARADLCDPDLRNKQVKK